MFKFIKKLFGYPKINNVINEEPDVWDVERVVNALFNIGVGDRSANHEYILPLRPKETDYKCSNDYFYLQLLSALRAFKGDREWETYDDRQLISYMISENFSEDKKNKFLELFGEIDSQTQYTLDTRDVFDIFERNCMIDMLLEFIYSAKRFQKAWTGYSSFGYGGSIVYKFMCRSSIKYMNKPLETAFYMICLLLGDDYDQPIMTDTLKKHYGYPLISNKELSDLAYEDEFC